MKDSNLNEPTNTFEETESRDKENNLLDRLSLTMISKIKDYRILKDVSHRKLARESGVSQIVIYRMEGGSVIPPFEALVKLAEVLDLDVEITVKEKD